MSRLYAQAAVAALESDTVIAGWATGGIRDRDPRRSGPNQTSDAFSTDPDGDILPTIAVVGGMAVRPFTRMRGAVEEAIEVRLFAQDYTSQYDALDSIAVRIRRLLNDYRASNELPGVFQWESRLGLQYGGAFEDVVYDEVRFQVMSVEAPLEVAL